MSRHPSLDELSDFVEGVLGRRKAGKVSSHLSSGCAQCGGHVAELQQVTGLLSSASMTFGPMPDEYSARIDMAIASEASARLSSVPASGEASRRDLPVRGQQARGEQRRRGWRLPVFSSPLAGSLAAVGAAVVIAGGGYAIATNLNSGSSSSSSVSASAPHSSPVPSSVHQGAAAAPASSLRFGPEVRFQHAGHQDSIHSVQTTTNYAAASLVAQARAVIAAVRQNDIGFSNQELKSPYAAPASAPVIGTSQLHACVGRIASGQDVLLVDLARFDGKPAVVIAVGKAPDGPGFVYAVGPACSASTSDILAKNPLPRP